MQISVRSQTAAETTLSWQPVAGAARYRILWSDRPGETVRFKTAGESGESLFTFCRSTHIPYYIKVQALAENGALLEESTPVQTPVGRVLQQQLEALSRGLVAVTANTGVFISWRLFKSEVTGHNATGLTGTDFVLYKNGVRLATVTDSTNYLDAQGTSGDTYAVAPLVNGVEGPACRGVKPWQKGYYELPLQKPADGVTPAGEPFAYTPGTADELLAQLAERLCCEQDFPHEIGVFLGYPLADVIGFIQNRGKNFTACGYWKVYTDPTAAQAEFDRYKKCERIYARCYYNGTPIRRLTVAA